MSHPLTVALVQLRAFDLADHQQAWTELLRRIDDAAAEGPRLIVLPEAVYPAFVLGSPEAYAKSGVRIDAEILGAIVERAQRHDCYIAAGLVLRGIGGPPLNVAVLFAPDGTEIARAIEAAPASWFAGGDGPRVATLDGVAVGLIAGDDARDPAAVASLAASGVRLLIGTRAGAAWGRSAERLPEPEAHTLLAARAAETGAWGVAPGKIGVEATSRVYAGRAGVVDPQGKWIVRAPAHQPGTVRHTLDLDAAPGADRFGTIEEPNGSTASMPAPASVPEPFRVAAIALDPLPSAVELMERLRAIAQAVVAQGAALIVLPDLAGADARAVTSAESLPLLQALSAESGIVLAVTLADREGSTRYKTAYLIDRGEVITAHRQTRLDAAERSAGFLPGNGRTPIASTSAGNIALISGHEGLTPALTAGVRSRGASLIAWCAGQTGPALEALTWTRAIEQRLPVVAAGTASSGGAAITSGAGTVLAVTLEGQTMAAQATLSRLPRA